MKKLEALLDTHARSLRLVHYDPKVVMVPHEHVRQLAKGFHQQKATIATDRNLTDAGKMAALEKARTTTRAAITAWHEQRLKNLDADLLEQRAALLSDNTMPDPKHIDLMASHMQRFSPQELATLYDKASESERRTMEAASASAGRVMVKVGNGVQWQRLLDPQVVADAILARAEATNPAAAQKVRELTEIRAMQETITNVALSEI